MKKLINFLFPSYRLGTAMVISAYIIDEHDEVVVRDDLPSIVPMLVRMPREFMLVFKNSSGKGEFKTDEQTYHEIPFYRELAITYRNSRIWPDVLRIKHLHFKSSSKRQ